jgi:hypothetical protein
MFSDTRVEILRDKIVYNLVNLARFAFVIQSVGFVSNQTDLRFRLGLPAQTPSS